MNIGDPAVATYLQSLIDVVVGVDDDPFGWALLGAYFGVAHELDAAIAANKVALDRITRLEERVGEAASADFLTDLELRCRANLSRALTAQDRASEALDLLGKDLPADADTAIARALVTAATLALIGIEQPEAALAMLGGGQAEPATSPRIEREAYDYPRFGRQWPATSDYLRARAHYARGAINQRTGDEAGAREAYQSAVDILRAVTKGSPKFWEARFLHAVSLAALHDVESRASGGDFAPSRRTPIDLLSALRTGLPPGKILRPEVISYNLASMHAQQGALDAAIRDYRRALTDSLRRDCETFDRFEDLSVASSCNVRPACADLDKLATFVQTEVDSSFECDTDCERQPAPTTSPQNEAAPIFCDSVLPEPFTAAFNNLGVLHIDKALVARTSGDTAVAEKALADADRALQAGLIGPAPPTSGDCTSIQRESASSAARSRDSSARSRSSHGWMLVTFPMRLSRLERRFSSTPSCGRTRRPPRRGIPTRQRVGVRQEAFPRKFVPLLEQLARRAWDDLPGQA